MIQGESSGCLGGEVRVGERKPQKASWERQNAAEVWRGEGEKDVCFCCRVLTEGGEGGRQHGHMHSSREPLLYNQSLFAPCLGIFMTPSICLQSVSDLL